MKNKNTSGTKQISTGRTGLLAVVSLCLALGGAADAQQMASLQWSPSAGASGYALYVGPASGYYTSRIDVGTNTLVNVSGLAAGTTNCFVVTAYNQAGLESPASNLAELLTTATNQVPVLTNNPVTNNPVTFATAPLSITNNGRLLITAAGFSNQTWLVQASTDLTDWNFVFTNAAGKALSYTTALPTGVAGHFYRAVGVIGAVNSSNITAAVSDHNFAANAVGFVRVNAGSGETLLANPFDCGNNTVAALMPSVSAGCVLYEYTTGNGYTSNTFSGTKWSAGGMTLLPGDGCFFYNPTRTTQRLTFTGKVLQGSVTNYVPVGYSISSPMIPTPNALATLPAAPGDVIQCYNGKWIDYTNVSGAWVGNSRNGPLTINAGNAFFITKSTAANWVQDWTQN